MSDSRIPVTRAFSPPRALSDAAIGLIVAVALVILAGIAATRFIITDPNLSLLTAYLAVWLPLLGAVIAAVYLHGSRSLRRDIGLAFHPLDLLWGLAAGLLARALAGIIEIAVYGQMATGAVTLGVPVRDLWWLFAALLAPVILAPVIEELFFRGVLLRSISGVTALSGGSPRLAMALAILGSATVFALLHVITVQTTDAALVAGLSTFVFGVAAASVAVATGRIGGPIVAHIAFNGLVVVPGLL